MMCLCDLVSMCILLIETSNEKSISAEPTSLYSLMLHVLPGLAPWVNVNGISMLCSHVSSISMKSDLYLGTLFKHDSWSLQCHQCCSLIHQQYHWFQQMEQTWQDPGCQVIHWRHQYMRQWMFSAIRWSYCHIWSFFTAFYILSCWS